MSTNNEAIADQLREWAKQLSVPRPSGSGALGRVIQDMKEVADDLSPPMETFSMKVDIHRDWSIESEVSVLRKRRHGAGIFLAWSGLIFDEFNEALASGPFSTSRVRSVAEGQTCIEVLPDARMNKNGVVFTAQVTFLYDPVTWEARGLALLRAVFCMGGSPVAGKITEHKHD